MGGDVGVDGKFEQLARGERLDAAPPEEIVDVRHVLAQKVERPRVVQVHRLAHVYDVQLLLGWKIRSFMII